jgi:hypothetical protein
LRAFHHRKLADADLYYVDNRNDRLEQVEATFRIEGKAPELGTADTGQIEPAAYHIENGRTAVPLHLDPYVTLFVVFRKPAASPSRTLPQRTETACIAKLELGYGGSELTRPVRHFGSINTMCLPLPFERSKLHSEVANRGALYRSTQHFQSSGTCRQPIQKCVAACSSNDVHPSESLSGESR